MTYWKHAKDVPGFDGDTIEEGACLPEALNADVVEKLVEFTTKFADAEFALKRPLDSADLAANGCPDWAVKFLEALTLDQKFDMLIAADEVRFEELSTILAGSVAAYIKSLSPEVLDATFALDREFTPEEMAEIRKEESWAETD
eukprot:CAMPEP_0116830136 /NCGR_PEP_ID=MMETSP0418-20121206/4599_1 /TAXON_ID=1158023 /ORGANISM="Astrosyne radiata, Strain 13vi08-1A" /LENGTH=143 /DNA_ID=CAMNT_0004459213 /DNA_START=6 /DNA_END=437 /DNA_ORIENTATION=-